eukprot:2661890-Alexandrium_andersonii.AAC.1
MLDSSLLVASFAPLSPRPLVPVVRLIARSLARLLACAPCLRACSLAACLLARSRARIARGPRARLKLR